MSRTKKVSGAGEIKAKEKEQEKKEDFVVIKVELTSGKFKSEIVLPLSADQEHIEAALGNWWQTLESVIKCRKNEK